MSTIDNFIYRLMRKGELPGATKLIGKTVSGVKKLIVDSAGKILLATGTAVPVDGGAGYAKGCLFIDTDVGAGTSGIYENVGTTTACNFDKFAASNTTFDNLGDAGAAGTISLSTFAQNITSAKTDGDMLIIDGQGDFGDVSVLRVQSSTGNPTDGTVLEVVSHDANVDPLVVSSSGQAGALIVGQNGSVAIALNLDVTGTLTAGVFETDAVTASTTDGTLLLNGDGAGGVNIGTTSNGNVTLGDDVVVSDTFDVLIGEGKLTIDDDQNESALIITSDATTAAVIDVDAATTTGNVLDITADALAAGGAMVNLDSDGIGAGAFYLKCYDGSANDLTISANGVTEITGAASTDIITITAGDIQLTAGDIDVDEGIITVDVTTDQTSYFKRNQGVTTGPVVEIEETAAAADNAVLLIDQNATAAASYGIEVDSAGGTCILVKPEATTGDGIEFSVPDSYTGQLIKVADTLVGTNGEGVIDIKTTANMATGAHLVRLDADTGTLAGATNGFILDIDDDSGAQATSYAMCINSANNEALYVQTGIAKFAEQIVCDAGINSDAGLDVDLATNADLVNITNAAADLAAGDGVVTVYGSATAGQTNAAYLLRLAWKANGDAQDNFILCEDNSTGAAGNGDDMFKVDSGGNVTTAGKVSIGTFLNLGAATELTIDGDGAIAVTRSYHSVDTNADGATDDLSTISGGTEGDVVVLRANNSGRSVVVKNGVGNILCGADVTLDNVADSITLLYDGANWLKIASSDNAA